MRIICDKCEKPFEVDAQPGDKVECPRCGDVNIVRVAAGATSAAAAAPAAKEDRAAAAGHPPAFGPEVNVIRLRPAMFRAKPFRFLLLVVGLFGGAAGALVLLSMEHKPWAIAAGAGGLLSGIVLAGWRIKTMHDGLLITTRRIIDRSGLLSKKTSEVMLKDIRHVVVTQKFMERLFSVGTLAISSSSDDGVEIYMQDVPKPEEVKRIIDLYR